MSIWVNILVGSRMSPDKATGDHDVQFCVRVRWCICLRAHNSWLCCVRFHFCLIKSEVDCVANLSIANGCEKNSLIAEEKREKLLKCSSHNFFKCLKRRGSRQTIRGFSLSLARALSPWTTNEGKQHLVKLEISFVSEAFHEELIWSELIGLSQANQRVFLLRSSSKFFKNWSD